MLRDVVIRIAQHRLYFKLLVCNYLELVAGFKHWSADCLELQHWFLLLAMQLVLLLPTSPFSHV